MIFSAKTKAAKVVAKAKELCTKLAEAAKAAVSPPGHSMEPAAAKKNHSHIKSKGDAGAPSPCTTGSLILQYSPQRKTMLANKRVSIHSLLRFAVCQLEELLSSDGSYLSDSSGDEVLVVGKDAGKDTSNKPETSFVVSSNRRDILLCNTPLEACGGCRYISPLA